MCDKISLFPDEAARPNGTQGHCQGFSCPIVEVATDQPWEMVSGAGSSSRVMPGPCWMEKERVEPGLHGPLWRDLRVSNWMLYP